MTDNRPPLTPELVPRFIELHWFPDRDAAEQPIVFATAAIATVQPDKAGGGCHIVLTGTAGIYRCAEPYAAVCRLLQTVQPVDLRWG